MRDRILTKACIASNRGALAAIALMLCVAVASAAVAVALSFDGKDHVVEAMDALGYGDVTVWAEGADATKVADRIEESPDVESASVQPLVFSPYTVNGFSSDDEGQLLPYEPNLVRYRHLDDERGFAPEDGIALEQGEIYVSPAMISTAQVRPQDVVSFRLFRTGETFDFKVAGYFEDGFMGSSMVDMKSFLISKEDFSTIESLLAAGEETDALAKPGCMVHVFLGSDVRQLPILADNSSHATPYASSIAFSHTRDAMAAYQLLQQNIFAGFLVAIAVALTLVALFVSARAVAAAIESDRRNIIALKTEGYESMRLGRTYMVAFGLAALAGCVAGCIMAAVVLSILPPLLAPMSGMYMAVSVNAPVTCCVCVIVIAAILGVVVTKLRTLNVITPIAASEAMSSTDTRILKRVHLNDRAPGLSLALKALAAHAGNYASIFAISLLLATLVCGIARLSSWVGPAGEGLMEAFSAADHDIGIQPLGPMDIKAAEDVMNQQDSVIAVYALAMEPVSVDSQQLKANAIDDASYFHILEGAAPRTSQEIVLTEMSASALGASIGDIVSVSGPKGTAGYRVSGLYLCANEMGQNLGMTMQGYERIGGVEGYIWCYHYVLADGTRNEQILQELTARFGTVAAIHSNSWSGLDGLVDATRLLLIAAFILAAAMIATACMLSSSRTIASERRDIAIEKMLGFASGRLRRSFVLRIAIVAALGVLTGSLLAAVFADSVLGMLLATFGIGRFDTASTFGNTILPGLAIVLFAISAAWRSSRSIRKVLPAKLLTEG